MLTVREFAGCCFVVITATGCDSSSRVPLPQRMIIEVTGSHFEWHVRYAGCDETLGTNDDFLDRRNILLLAGVDTTVELRSDDYLYNFAIPDLELHEIAVPDLEFRLRFTPHETGDFILQGDQLCGYQHPRLLGKVSVLGREDFAEWLMKRKPETAD